MKKAGNDSANPDRCAASAGLQPRLGYGRPDWRRELAGAIRDPAQLLQRLQLDPALLPAAREASRLFPLLVPPHYLSLIRPGDPSDPLLRQVLPLAEESAPQPLRFVTDPLRETGPDASQVGLIEKYQGRKLLVTTGACAINCRYCFRRHFPYQAHQADADWEAQLAALRQDETLREVILSGGDPLMLSDRRLAALLKALDNLPQLSRIRIHSRLPLVLPSRVTGRLLDLLDGLQSALVLVVHANHPREIDDRTADALRRLHQCGHVLLNQSVLLRGVNDAADTLASLSERLFAAGVLPYYLHQLDPVLGSAHFEVPDRQALQLHAELNCLLPGYLVPRLVREIAGAGAKLPLQASMDQAVETARHEPAKEPISC